VAEVAHCQMFGWLNIIFDPQMQTY